MHRADHKINSWIEAYSEDRSAIEKINRMMEHSSKYNLGPSRPTHQPWVGLRFADGDRVDYTGYYIDPESAEAAGVLEIQFHETGDSTLTASLPNNRFEFP